jgi:hypothetical protein
MDLLVRPADAGPIRAAPEPQCRATWTSPQPMAGAPLTGYDVLSSTGVEAMKKPSNDNSYKLLSPRRELEAWAPGKPADVRE